MKVFIIFVGLLVGFAVAIPSKLKTLLDSSCLVYSNTGLSGAQLQIQEYIEDLSKVDFDNTIQSAVTDGIWLFYEDFKFNELNFGKRSFFGWGTHHEIHSFGTLNKVVSSVRFSGAGESMKYDTINFYEGSGFMGREQYYFTDAPSLNYDNFGRSIIVTGCSPWTLCEDKNYKGTCICVYPSSVQDCEPGFYLEPKDFDGFENKVSSLRKGCSSSKVFKGTPVYPNTTRIFSLHI